MGNHLGQLFTRLASEGGRWILLRLTEEEKATKEPQAVYVEW